MSLEVVQPRSVRYEAYKRAVAASLVTIFHISEVDAGKTVDRWWDRLQHTRAATSGIFLHSEPVQTAAELLGQRRKPLTQDQRVQYKKILHDSLQYAKAAYQQTQELPSDASPIINATVVPVFATTPSGKKKAASTAKKSKLLRPLPVKLLPGDLGAVKSLARVRN